MITFIPVFPTSELEKKILEAQCKQDSIFHSLATGVENLNTGPVFIATNMPAMYEFARESGFQVEFVDQNPAEEPVPAFPHGGTLAYQALRKARPNLPEKEVLLCLSPRNAALTPEIVRTISLAFLEQPENLLVSVIVARDHPSQLDAYYQISSMDVLMRFTKTPQPAEIAELCEGLSPTFPCTFDWETYNVGWKSTGPRIFQRDERQGQIRLSPLNSCPAPEDAQAAQQTSPKAWYVMTRPGEALRLCPPQQLRLDKPFTLAGVPFIKPESHFDFLLVEREGRDELELFVAKELCTLHRLARIWAIKNCELQRDSADTISFSKEAIEGEHALLFQGRPFVGPIHTLCKEDADGWAVALLQRTEGTDVDHIEPFELSEDLWKIDPLTKRRINVKTKSDIVGRQDFPEIYQPDGTFLFFLAGFAGRLQAMLKQGRVRGYVAPESHLFDLL